MKKCYFLIGLSLCLAANSSATGITSDLISFSGNLENGNILLSWSFDQMDENAKIILEKSEDGSSYDLLNKITKVTTSQYTDDRFVRDSYYRLSRENEDGSRSVIKTIFVPITKVRLDCIPLNSALDGSGIIHISSLIPLIGSVKIIALDGTEHHHTPLEKREIDISTLSAGIYFLKIEGQETGLMSRFVIE